MRLIVPSLLAKYDGAPLGAVALSELYSIAIELRHLLAVIEREARQRSALFKRERYERTGPQR
jgi:hypothetical protein